MTEEQVAATGVKPGTPKFEKAWKTMIATHLNARPKQDYAGGGSGGGRSASTAGADFGFCARDTAVRGEQGSSAEHASASPR